VQKRHAGDGRLRQSDTNLQPFEQETHAPLAPMETPRDVGQPDELVDGRRRVIRSRDDLDVPDRVLAASQ
jgi:hypothetical protein